MVQYRNAKGNLYMNRLKNIRILRQAFRQADVDKVFKGYLGCFVVVAFVIWLAEPSIDTFLDSLWYCFSIATTVGFGDIAAATLLGRLLTMILSIYSIGVVAIFTAIVASFFMDTTKSRASESVREFLYDLEHLPELSKEELQALSDKVRHFNQ